MDKSHVLAPSWENAKMFISADGEDTGIDTVMHLFALDWFALRVEEHSKTHIIEGDTGLSHILYEWRDRMPLNPMKLN